MGRATDVPIFSPKS